MMHAQVSDLARAQVNPAVSKLDRPLSLERFNRCRSSGEDGVVACIRSSYANLRLDSGSSYRIQLLRRITTRHNLGAYCQRLGPGAESCGGMRSLWAHALPQATTVDTPYDIMQLLPRPRLLASNCRRFGV